MFSINLDLQRSVGLTSASGGSAEAATSFGLPGGVNIALIGPVFDLPPGYKASSTQAHIVNNECLPAPILPAVPGAAIGVLTTLVVGSGADVLRARARVR